MPEMTGEEQRLARQARRARRRYWAFVDSSGGYAVDFYPEEEARHRRYIECEGTRILGTFNTGEEALEAVRREVRRMCDVLNARR